MIRARFLFYFLFIFISIRVSAQTKAFHNLSKYEKHWAMVHPFAALKIKKHQAEMYAVYTEVKKQHILDNFENGGKLDAFRHTFAMAYFSKYIRPGKLRKLGKAHEKANHWQFLHHLADEDGELSDSLSSVMDLKNNDIALSLAKEVKKLSPEEIKQKVIVLVQAGAVFIIKRNAQGQYVDCNNQLIAPEKLKTWNTPKCLVKSIN
jgi:hypothetical protein